MLRRLRDGPPHVQLYILRQMGEALPSSAWSQFMEGFSSLSPAVQARPDASTSPHSSPKKSLNVSVGTASSSGGVIVALDAMA